MVALFLLVGLIVDVLADCEIQDGICPSDCNLVQGMCLRQSCSDFIFKLKGKDDNPFIGSIEFINGTLDLNVTISYEDEKYSDEKFFGISKGENTESCLTMTIWMFQNSKYQSKQKLIYPIQYLKDGISQRAYSYKIPSLDFPDQLLISEDDHYFNFEGFHRIYFNIGESQQRIFQYDFKVKIQKILNVGIETTFGSITSKTVDFCKVNKCTMIPKSILEFCNDENCSQTTNTKQLYLNDQVWLKQSIQTSGLEGYYLIDPVIYIIGKDIFKQVTIKDKKVNQKGFSLYLITAEIAWSTIQISAAATIQSSIGNRFLTEGMIQDEYNFVQTTSKLDIDCVYSKQTNQCCQDIECKSYLFIFLITLIYMILV